MLLLVAGTLPLAAAQPRVTQADLLRRVVDVDRLTTPPAEERTRLFSSYDRRSRIEGGRYIDWAANEDHGHFIDTTDDGWDVMAALDGPGALTRIWSANPNGQLRIEIDGEVVIDTTFEQLLAGEVKPILAPLVDSDRNCYFPLGFSKRCRVLSRDSADLVYQVNCMRFPAGTRVQSFQAELDADAQAAFQHVSQVLAAGPVAEPLLSTRRLFPVALHKELESGQKLRESLEAAGTIRGLHVALTDRVSPRALYALHRCVLRIWFDDQEQPAVEAPLIDFFGSGFDFVGYDSLVLGTEKLLMGLPLPERRASQATFMYSYWPMPFRTGWRLEIENLNDDRRAVGLLLLVRVDTRAPTPDALYFHARYRKEDPAQRFEYPAMYASGPGRLVGCVLNVDCPRANGWRAGDHKIWLDDEAFPTYFGTNMAGFFGAGARWQPQAAPLHGVTRAGRHGKNSAYRWMLSDCVNFQQSIGLSFEDWRAGGAPDTYYSSVAYWYAPADGQHFFDPLDRDDLELPGLRIPGTVEIEGHILSEDWGNEVQQKYAGGVELSGEALAAVSTDEPVRIRLPVSAAGAFRLKLRAHPERPFGEIAVRDASGATVGVVQYDRAARGMYEVGKVQLEAGANVLVVQCDRTALLDCWILEPLPAD